MNSRIVLPDSAEARLTKPVRKLIVPKHVVKEQEAAAAAKAKEKEELDEKEQWRRAKAEREQLGRHRRATVLKVGIRRAVRAKRRRDIRNQARIDQVLFDLKTVDSRTGERKQPHRPAKTAVRQRVTRGMVWDAELRRFVWLVASTGTNPTPYAGLPRRERRAAARAEAKQARHTVVAEMAA